MVAIRLDTFGGMVPAVDDRLLPQNQAARSEHVWLYNGTLEGMREPVLVHTCTDPDTQKVFRLPRNAAYDKSSIADSDWLEFTNKDTDVIRAPLDNDTYERYYWAASAGEPQYNTKARILDSDPPLRLGVPPPDAAPGVSTTTGTGTQVTRAYVVTFVTDFGEEGPPSAPTLFTGDQAGTWTVTWVEPTYTDRLLDKARIYRTVTSSQGIATYYYVAEVDIATETYADTIDDTDVVAANTLQTTGWTEPPDDLQGMVAMPNGLVAGWREKEIWFCEPYRPHAWPVAYVLTVDYDVVGLGVLGQSLIVCTTATPFAITGIHPSMMAVSQLATVAPCLSRGSIVSTPLGVIYASQSGLVLATPASANIVTGKLFSKKNWLEIVQPQSLSAALLGGAYLAFGAPIEGTFESTAFDEEAFEMEDYTGSYEGTLIDFDDPRVAFNIMRSESPCESLMNDPWSGEVLMVRDGEVLMVDVTDSAPYAPYLWRSRIMETPTKKNLGVIKVNFIVPAGTATLNPVPNADLEQDLAADQYGLVRFYADGNHIWTRELRTSGEVMRLPSGYKAEFVQVEIEARVTVLSIQLASTAKELVRV
jgi:hypothetical protein